MRSLRERNKLFLAHYLISFRTYEIKRFPVWWDCASLLETVGSGGNKFVPMFYTFPRCFSSKHFNPQFFSGACRTSHGARRCTRKLPECSFSRIQMYLALLHFVPREKLLSFQRNCLPAASRRLTKSQLRQSSNSICPSDCLFSFADGALTADSVKCDNANLI